MKKRLLITSIVMMLVCAVALSTATYAWFTSNASVSASTMTLKAAVSDEAALGIGWTGSRTGTSIVSDIYETLKPMAPMVVESSAVVELENGKTIYESASGNPKLNFYNSTVKEEDGVVKFNKSTYVNGSIDAERNEEPVVYTQNKQYATLTDSTQTNAVKSFYIRNLSSANTIQSVTVSAIFPGEESAEVNFRATTDSEPVEGTDYYVYVDQAFVKCEATNNYAIVNDQFDPNFTYFEVAEAMVPTKDTSTANGTTFVDTVYYVKTGENSYVPVDHAEIVSDPREGNGGVLVRRTGSSPNYTYTNLYEELSGNDMIRVALFTQEYRHPSLANENCVEGSDGKLLEKKGVNYYWYNPSTNIMTFKYIGLENGTREVKDLYVVEPNHTLLGVLGKEQTNFYKTPEYDLNKVYYAVSFKTATVTSDTFKTNGSLYKAITGGYAPITDKTEAFNGGTTYYEVENYLRVNASNDNYVIIDGITGSNFNNFKSQLYIKNGDEYVTQASEDFDSTADYYVMVDNLYAATSTVANGEIKINKPVKDLYYYTDVTTTLTFANELKPGEQIDIIAVVWLDGTELNDTRAAELAQVSLLFETNSTSNN